MTVYKAGAGSGKTFTLSSEYIKKLILQPACYRNILAVTFTNKATGEMKTRILSQLYGIWKRLPDSRQYLQKIAGDLAVPEAVVERMSGEALRYILHDYSHFRIETIDTFFQSVLRNIARELDLTANLRVELNDDQVESDAVDAMIENLHSRDEVLRWIMLYINENVEESKNWNIIGEIKEFGKNIFKDSYKLHTEAFERIFQTPDFFDSFLKKVHAVKQQSINEIKETAQRFFDVAEERGLVCDDFARKGSGVWGYFDKMRGGIFDENAPNSYVRAALLDPDAWVAKSNKDKRRTELVLDAVRATLFQMLNEAEPRRAAALKAYRSADVTLRNIHKLRLLNSIETTVRQMNADANRFLLSDTPSLLHALVKDNDAPFIFEKIGAQLDYIMIDEFQDTSVMQWKNFKVLLDECMSRSKEGNLIVGDVKQSIYRWRSGDWRLLNNIASKSSDADARVDVRTLGFNYRSCRNIVDFNNALFQEAAKNEARTLQGKTNDGSYAEQLLRAYADVSQQVPDGKGAEGLVRVDLLPNIDYDEQTLARIKETIQGLIDSGVRQENIAILARRKEKIQLIADYFANTSGHISIVSDEAFKLENSAAVSIIISAMRLLLHPEDNVSRALIAKLYHKHVLRQDSLTDTDILVRESEGLVPLPKGFDAVREQLKKQPLYDIVMRLCEMFELDKLAAESSYICTFFDQLTAFTADKPADVESFLNEWDSRIHAETIQANSVEGVRIMTIHKCKGLEFDNVIVPFCDWQVDHMDLIWCSPSQDPYSLLPVIPINYSGTQLSNTIYTGDYNSEFFQKRVDSLNLLYVAFTRAAHNLFIIGKRGNATLCSDIIETALPALGERLNNEPFAVDKGDKKTPLSFSYGSLFVPQKRGNEATRNLFLRHPEPITATLQTHKCVADFRQSNESSDFIKGGSDDEQSRYIEQGLVLHKLFSTIRTADDIEGSVRELEFEGVLNDCGMSRQSLVRFLDKRVRSPRTADWFSGRWQLFNERSILSRDEMTGLSVVHRPDRVMTDGREVVVVDFKFGRPRPEYRQQVFQYMSLIAGMGYENIKGYLWFVYSNEIEEVYE